MCLLPRQNHQRKVVKSGVDSTHQDTRTESSISSSASLCKGPVSQGWFSEDGQNYCGGICEQYGTYPLGPSDVSCSRDVDLLSSAGYPNFSPACSCKGKYYSRYRILCNSSNWCRDPKLLAPFLKNCNTDLFASWLTAQLPQYISWRPDPGAFHIDALTLHWKLFTGYVFPPFNLIPMVLNKVVRARADQVLVAPSFTSSTMVDILLSLLISYPVLLPQSIPFTGSIRFGQGTSNNTFNVPTSPSSHRDASPAMLSSRGLSWTGYQTTLISHLVCHWQSLSFSLVPVA